MNDYIDTPVLFLIFNRPEQTKKVFETIRKAKPKQLFIASDGPREGNERDVELNKAVKDIVEEVDWDCNVKKLYRQKNLGCGKAVSEAITWFFHHVQKGIVLEDDCYPDLTFFSFCEELLKVYEADSRIFQISGSNFQYGIKRGNGDYYFSKLPQMWGWASWKRAWKFYQFDIDYEDRIITSTFPGKSLEGVRNEWLKVFRDFNKGMIDTWDYQWMFAVWKMDGLVIVPNKSLVYNIGFGDDATHTNFTPNYYKRMKLESIVSSNIRHPRTIEVCVKADAFEQKKREGKLPFFRVLGSKLKFKITSLIKKYFFS